MYELSRYEEQSAGIFACADNETDDCVTSLIWALYYIETDFYDGRTDEVKKVEDRFKVQDEEDTGPVYFIG